MTYNLRNCIALLQESVQLLDNSTKVLHETTKDIPRIRRVLRTRQVFGLVPESDLADAKETFKSEINPKVDHFVRKIEVELSRQRKQKTKLQNKYNLQLVRLQGNASSGNGDDASPAFKKEALLLARLAQAGGNDVKLSKLKFLRNKRERLKYSLSRLNLQDRKVRLQGIEQASGSFNEKVVANALLNAPSLSPPS